MFLVVCACVLAVQVFKHLDSRTLTTAIPLVCQHWKAAAACGQIWTPRCDPQLLASVQQQTPGAAASETSLGFSSDAASTASTTLSTQAVAVCSTAAANNPLLAATKPCYTVALPLLHHSVYSFNLLRNPQFLAAANADFSSSILRSRSGSSTGGSGRAAAVLTSEQRKFAWVRLAVHRSMPQARSYVSTLPGQYTADAFMSGLPWTDSWRTQLMLTVCASCTCM